MEISNPKWGCKFTIQVILLLAFGIFNTAWAQLNIELTLDKSTYLEDEPIWIEAVERNIGDKIEWTTPFRPSVPEFCKFVLKNSAGKQFDYKGGSEYITYDLDRHPNGIEMPPGESIYLVKGLLGIFGDRDENHVFVFHLPPDSYTLQVIHHTNWRWLKEFHELSQKIGGVLAKEQVDKGTVYSNTVEFEIVEPEGEERVVQQKLLSAYRLQSQIHQGSTVQFQIYPILDDILTNYPNSVYTKAAHLAQRGSVAYKVGKTTWDIRESLHRFNESIYSFMLIGRRTKTDYALKYFPRVLHEYPESKAAEYIRNVVVKNNPDITLEQLLGVEE